MSLLQPGRRADLRGHGENKYTMNATSTSTSLNTTDQFVLERFANQTFSPTMNTAGEETNPLGNEAEETNALAWSNLTSSGGAVNQSTFFMNHTFVPGVPSPQHNSTVVDQIHGYLTGYYYPTLDVLAIAGIVFALVFTVYGSRLKRVGLFVQGGMAGAIASQYVMIQFEQDIPAPISLSIALLVAMVCGFVLLCSFRASKFVIALSFGLVIAYSLGHSIYGMMREEFFYIALFGVVGLGFLAAYKAFDFTVAASSSATAGLCFIMGVNRFAYMQTGLSVSESLQDSKRMACNTVECWALISAGLFLAVVGTIIQWRNLCDARHEVVPPEDPETKLVTRRTKSAPEYMAIV